MKCIVLSVNPYSFPNENGEVVQGLSVHYLYGEDLKSVVGLKGALGVPVLKQSFPMDFRANFVHAPALYDFNFESRPVNGKMTMIPVSADYVGDIECIVGGGK